MSNTNIVVESGDIRCVHGGKVILVSSQKIHTIGGQKPIHVTDFLGASISGCPKKSPCTKVASISSAVTEHNVSAAGLKYLLRTDGSKTNKGAALVLNSPGQFTHKIKAKSSESAGYITQKILEDAIVEKQTNIKKELYRIYPLRESSNNLRGLRGTRDFILHEDFYSINNGTYKKDKVVTYSDAYLYVTHNKKTKTYQVISRGEKIQDTQFQNLETGVISKYIPFYEESGKLEFVYSNLKLSKDDLSKFKLKTTIDVENKENNFVYNAKEYSKNRLLTKKDLKSMFTPLMR